MGGDNGSCSCGRFTGVMVDEDTACNGDEVSIEISPQ